MQHEVNLKKTSLKRPLRMLMKIMLCHLTNLQNALLANLITYSSKGSITCHLLVLFDWSNTFYLIYVVLS